MNRPCASAIALVSARKPKVLAMALDVAPDQLQLARQPAEFVSQAMQEFVHRGRRPQGGCAVLGHGAAFVRAIDAAVSAHKCECESKQKCSLSISTKEDFFLFA